MRLAGLLVVLLTAAPAVAQTSDPRIALMERAAWNALSNGQNKTAAEIFRQALASDPNNAQLYLGVATAAYADRRDDEAKAAVDRALSLDPKLPSARQLAGRVLHRQGSLLEAIRTYESLARDAAGDATTRPTLDRWRREFDLQLQMQQTFGDRFAVSFEGPAEAALAEKAVA